MYRTVNAHNYDPEWLMTKVTITRGCWLWKGSMYQNGYGKYGKKGLMAHRIFYTLFKGKVPEYMSLDHLCRIRKCVNPDHLEIVSMVENVMRGDSQHAQNARKTHCKHGHQFDETNTQYFRGSHRRCGKCHAIAEATRRNKLKKE